MGFLVSCMNRHLPDVDGMWQLKTIEDNSGYIQTVDTIYYSFQAQKLFAFTQLNGTPMQFESTFILHGYVDFPSNDHLFIHIDSSKEEYFSRLPWHSGSVSYFIQKLTHKEMILENEEGDIYRFIKF